MFNTSWEARCLPKAWKVALIMAILKSGKVATAVESYRPISLLPCIAKLMERMVYRRLYWILEDTKGFSSSQGGYRKRLSILEHIARLEHLIKNTYLQRKICLTVFIDLEGAFDTVSHENLIYKLLQKGIKGHLLSWLESFIKDRTFQIYYNGEISANENVWTGVPQGLILSPVLFNLYVSDISSMENVVITEYADDIALSIRGEYMVECTNRMQLALSRLH